jgi:hypothetical protein
MALIIGVLTLPAMLAAPAPARPDPAPAPAAEAARLVEQLADPDYRVREQAIEGLRRLGPPALPALKAAADHPEVEVRRRVHELIPLLEVEAALAPKRVTLKAQEQPLRQVLDALQEQSGYKIDVLGAMPDRKLSLDVADVTFWQALDAVAEDAGLVLEINQGFVDGRVRLRAADSFAPFVHHSGPFRVSADNLQQLRSLPLGRVPRGTGAPRRSETLTLEMTVSTEPRLPLLGVGEPQLLAAYDTERNSMLPPANQPAQGIENPLANRGKWNSGRFGSRSTSITTQFTLARPSEKATSIRSVRGIVPVAVLLEQKPTLVADKILEARGKKAEVGKTTIVIESVTEQPNKTYQVQLSVTAEDPEPGWANSLYQRFELQDAKGKAYNHHGAGWGNNGNNVRLTLNFGSPGNAGAEAPEKLVFQAWTTMQYPLEFEFKDVPLP